MASRTRNHVLGPDLESPGLVHGLEIPDLGLGLESLGLGLESTGLGYMHVKVIFWNVECLVSMRLANFFLKFLF